MANNVFSRTLGTPTPQIEQEDSRQVPNSAGGFTFTISDKQRLERFLILGTEGGTYYIDEKKLTKDNVAFLRELIERDEQLVREIMREVSESGRAFRNSAAIFCLAALFTYGKVKSSEDVARVCRTSTHLFEFVEYVELLSGWSRSKRRAVADWYVHMDVDKLAYQVIKYRQRNGWTHKDLLRLSHPVGLNTAVGDFVLGKEHAAIDMLPIIMGFKAAQNAQSVAALVDIMDEFPNLPWEALPTEYLKAPEVWKKLFYNGALNGQALVRNITRLARIDAFNDMVFAAEYAAKLVDEEMIKRTRLHPFQYLLAVSVHQNGQANRRDVWSYGNTKDWTTNPVIVTALNEGFYKAFAYVEPANKRTLIALDVSGSMSSSMAGIDLRACQVTAAMSMTIARTEPYFQIMGFANTYRDLGINPSMDLNTVMSHVVVNNFGSTNCSLPMVDARQKKTEIDTFIVMTDNETYAGSIHPHKALEKYRQAMGIDARLIVCSTTPTNFSIADPTDRGMLDICGADSNLPKLITEFSAGRI